jgi:hypothetical protein
MAVTSSVIPLIGFGSALVIGGLAMLLWLFTRSNRLRIPDWVRFCGAIFAGSVVAKGMLDFALLSHHHSRPFYAWSPHIRYFLYGIAFGMALPLCWWGASKKMMHLKDKDK